MKKYKLLKDSPVLKAGAIYENDGLSYKSKIDENTWDYIDSKYIENNPEWFEEVNEPKSPKEYLDMNEITLTEAINAAMIDSYNQAVNDVNNLWMKTDVNSREYYSLFNALKNRKTLNSEKSDE